MKYTVLSFEFGDYDLVREPKKADPDATYIMVSDREHESDNWDVKVDDMLVGRGPLYSSYYVRYHPFEFASTDVVVVLDASVQINDSLAPIVDEFVKSGADYAPMLTSYRDDEHKMEFFKGMGRITDDDIGKMDAYIASMNQVHTPGSIGCAFAMFRDTPAVRMLLAHVFEKAVEMGDGERPNRMDEVILQKELASFLPSIRVFPTSIQIIESTYMTYCRHGKEIPVTRHLNFDQMYYLCGRPVYPARFSKELNFPRAYRCRTEAMLLTKHLNPDDLEEWLEWHLEKVGFDRVHVFDNESDYDVRGICDAYGRRVSYELVEGHPRQYRLYDEYVNWRSRAEWIMPVDDDEFLDIGDFRNVAEAVDYYDAKFPHLDVLAIRWKHLFPKEFRRARPGRVLDYCTQENPELACKYMKLGDRTVKCIVRRTGPVHYEETWENPAGGHVPKHSCFYGALTCGGDMVLGCGVQEGTVIEDERLRLLHCRYKGPADWKKWHGPGLMTVSDAIPKSRYSI